MFQNLADFRLRCYRHILMLDTADCGTMHDETHFWTEASIVVRQCLAALKQLSSSSAPRPVGWVALSPAESIEARAQFLLTALVALQVGIRNYESLTTVIDSALLLLPKLTDARLRAHLLVHLYAETEDESLFAEARSLISRWSESSLSEEDHFLLQTYNAIEDETF